MRKGRWTGEEENFVRENYLQMSDEDIADILGIDEGSVKSRRLVLGCRRKEPGKSWAESEIDTLRDNLNKSDRELGEMLGRTGPAVQNKRMREGIIRAKQYGTKYRVKPDFFKNWSEEMAYILGISFADAYITNRHEIGYTFGISLIDEALVQKINKAMESTYPIKKRNYGLNGIIYELKFYTKEIYEQLVEKGLSERKSLNMKFPYIPDEFFWHFIRGYFDGDGTVRRNGRFLHLTIASGSKVFSEAMLKHLEERGISFSLYTRTKNRKNALYDLQARAKTTRKFCERMYENSNIYLERKYSIINGYLEQEPKLTRCIDCNKEITQKHKKHVLCKPCARIRMNYRSKVAKRKIRNEIRGKMDIKIE